MLFLVLRFTSFLKR
uniref:Uncharacterized protein n=1 Tax=Arundo donax TaxID=35708 RepID=A0A0A9AFI5_ARUDO